MKTGNAVVVFENTEIRKEWFNGEQWVPALDVAKALSYDNPSRAVKDILNRNKEKFQGFTTKRKLHRVEGGIEKGRLSDFLNLEGIVMFCMVSNMPAAIPFQRWAVKVLKTKLQEIPSDIRLISKQKRVKFTDDLKDHGCTKPAHYINITKDMKKGLDIDKNKPKDMCDLIEIMKIAASEDIARINLLQNNSDGYRECHDASVQATKAVNEGTKKVMGIKE